MNRDGPFKNRIIVQEINCDIRTGLMLVNLAESWSFCDPVNKEKALTEVCNWEKAMKWVRPAWSGVNANGVVGFGGNTLA